MKTTNDDVPIIKIDDRLALNKYDVDEKAHITVNYDICKPCDHKACLFACPAVCYVLESEQVKFRYEGCLECGTCRIICDKGAITWDYPRGGFGILFRYG